MIEFEQKKVLITGGLGFIGSTLAIRLVQAGAHVTVVDSLIPEYGGNLKNIDPVKGRVHVNISDVRDEHSMKYLIQGQDFLFNLSGQTSHLDSMENPFPDLEINARAQLSILETCRRYNPTIRLVFASTRQVYGAPESLPVDERHPLRPVDVNGINKLAGESYHLLYNNVYGIRSSVLRLTNTYGPRMRVKDARQTFLGIWVRRLVDQAPLLVYGDGKQIRDFNYVDDVVEALLLAAIREEAYGQIFNLGADDPSSLKDVAEMMTRISAGTYQIVPFPNQLKAIDIGDYYGDFRKIRSRLGWRPKVSLEEGLRRTIEYYREMLEYYI
jgi:nucleoside-diphosphate-sugar epimerase